MSSFIHLNKFISANLDHDVHLCHVLLVSIKWAFKLVTGFKPECKLFVWNTLDACKPQRQLVPDELSEAE
jgi:hypothetical protein